ncbi:AlpA family transcriptional regulator [Nitrosomonas sp. Nm34]|uniref:helix-turn-helix transcriptional regulator n=1 Tax=Nitrosomonas sp. Nm34 TaxID=1881055 RepID=UPI0008F3BE6B|nr:hypothetical protein [Nitrosomonas sp. Nm34]SFI70791.1 hypothetical protein SAMN05428978_102828 [Nitrosomonas sp. Nm34]
MPRFIANKLHHQSHIGNPKATLPMHASIQIHHLPETGYLRIHHIIGNPKAIPPIPAIIPVSRSAWWAGVKSGRYPQPVRTLGLRITAWSVESIRALIKQTGSEDNNA